MGQEARPACFEFVDDDVQVLCTDLFPNPSALEHSELVAP